jgi:hypothetical protein
MRSKRSIPKSLAAGAVGGLAGAFLMNQFQSAMKVAEKEMARRRGEHFLTKKSGDDATVKTAQAVSQHVFRSIPDARAKAVGGAGRPLCVRRRGRSLVWSTGRNPARNEERARYRVRRSGLVGCEEFAEHGSIQLALALLDDVAGSVQFTKLESAITEVDPDGGRGNGIGKDDILLHGWSLSAPETECVYSHQRAYRR